MTTYLGAVSAAPGVITRAGLSVETGGVLFSTGSVGKRNGPRWPQPASTKVLIISVQKIDRNDAGNRGFTFRIGG